MREREMQDGSRGVVGQVECVRGDCWSEEWKVPSERDCLDEEWKVPSERDCWNEEWKVPSERDCLGRGVEGAL